MRKSQKEIAESSRSITRRGLALGAIQMAVVSVRGLKLRSMQIEHADEYRLLSDGNSIKIELLPPARGLILDRNGMIIAGNEQNYRVTLTREEAGDVSAVIARLRETVPPLDQDRYLAPDLTEAANLVREGELTGIAAMEQRNIAKAQRFYDYVDGSQLYVNAIDPAWRSRMNIPFQLRDASRNEAFLAGAKAAGLLQLKGHKSVGGMRASLYNAMPLEGVKALVSFMDGFAKRHG